MNLQAFYIYIYKRTIPWWSRGQYSVPPAKGSSSVPGQGTKILQAVQPKEKEKK